jgi:hypothetical protein
LHALLETRLIAHGVRRRIWFAESVRPVSVSNLLPLTDLRGREQGAGGAVALAGLRTGTGSTISGMPMEWIS